MAVEMVKDRVMESIQEVTGAMISEDMIIPLCGEWALAGSKLFKSLISDHGSNREKRYREAASLLQNCPQLCLPGGQGQDYVEAVMSRFSPLDLVEKIDSVSGIANLKTRYKLYYNSESVLWLASLCFINTSCIILYRFGG